MSENRRRHLRKRVLRRARIVFRGGHSVIDCVLLDLSDGGARLKGTGLLALPERFELRLDNGSIYSAAVAYRGLDSTGVRFLEAV